DALGRQLLLQAAPGPPARGGRGPLPDHAPAPPRPPGLGGIAVDAGGAAVPRGHRAELPAVPRVGRRLPADPIPGAQPPVAECCGAGADPGPRQRGPVLGQQDGGPGALCGCLRPRHQAGFPSSTVARPRRNVATTWPGSVSPANGELRLREAWAAGSTVELVSWS